MVNKVFTHNLIAPLIGARSTKFVIGLALALGLLFSFGGQVGQVPVLHAQEEDPQGRATEAAWRAVYYNNMVLAGQPVFFRNEPEINHNWGLGSPDPAVNRDYFSARWTRIFDLPAGTYRFSVTGDDGVRVFLNDELILNGWWAHGVRTFTVDRPVAAGHHEIRVEYFERTGAAVVRFHFEPRFGTGGPVPGPTVTPTPVPSTGSGPSAPAPHNPPPPPPIPFFTAQGGEADATWRAEYYANRNLTGEPTLVRQDDAIDFHWGTGSPADEIPADNFSVRWARKMHFGGGYWRFTATTDDGVRLYINNQVVLDKWQLQGGVSHEVVVQLQEGVHLIRMEYFEQEREALARLAWESIPRPVTVGNLITCAPANPPNYAWIRVYRKDGDGNWYRAIPRGVGSIHPNGYIKIDGLPVDTFRFGGAGEPYWIEQWVGGQVAQSVGNTDRGEPEFRIRVNADNHTPWACP
jgi:hypothetical protein